MKVWLAQTENVGVEVDKGQDTLWVPSESASFMIHVGVRFWFAFDVTARGA